MWCGVVRTSGSKFIVVSTSRASISPVRLGVVGFELFAGIVPFILSPDGGGDAKSIGLNSSAVSTAMELSGSTTVAALSCRKEA